MIQRKHVVNGNCLNSLLLLFLILAIQERCSHLSIQLLRLFVAYTTKSVIPKVSFLFEHFKMKCVNRILRKRQQPFSNIDANVMTLKLCEICTTNRLNVPLSSFFHQEQ